MADYRETFEFWKNDPFFDEATRAELAGLTDEKEIEERFYRELEFGTAGLRGIMGAGTNRMNKYIIGRATAGYAKHLIAKFGEEAKTSGVAIAYDVRNNSAAFAKETALVMASFGIKAYLFEYVSATPLLSFAVRFLRCKGGVVVTASHNPKEYNGYKAYDDTGCQIGEEDADSILAQIAATDITSVKAMPEEEALAKGLLQYIGDDVMDRFLEAVEFFSNELTVPDKERLKVVYTPLNGTGRVPVMRMLKDRGFSRAVILSEQEEPDGNFPTLRSPNPEEKDALTLAIKKAEEIGADIVVGTDPDCDRVGVAVRGNNGMELMSGNQIGTLLTDYVIRRKKSRLNDRSCVIISIVTGNMGASIAESKGLKVYKVLTGFKNIGAKMTELINSGEGEPIFEYEESYGYLSGDYCRDKDAVMGTMLICEMAAYYKARGRSLIDVMNELYDEYGYYLDKVESFVLPGKDGAEKIKAAMEVFRAKGAKLMPGITSVKDFAPGIEGLPKANVLLYTFEDGSTLCARPSGTEPKFKFDYAIQAKDPASAEAVMLGMRKYITDIVEA